MSSRFTLGLIAVVVGVLVGGPLTSAARAEGGKCGNHCMSCQGAPNPDWHYGAGSGGGYAYYCTRGPCAGCSFFPTSRIDSTSTEAIVERLRFASSDRIEEWVAMYRSRLRYLPSRNAIAVMGGCEGRKVETIVTLDNARLSRLVASGIPRLQTPCPGSA